MTPRIAAPACAVLLALAASHAPAQTAPDDPFFASKGSWGQAYDDQWGLKRIGFDGGWAPPPAPEGRVVVIAVIDSGIDYFHPDLSPGSIWRNPNETPNGRDDDGNGYVDDLIGWNFVENNNDPWDRTGHGTHVAGIIAAAAGNREGIAGVNPRARIMPLRALNSIGRGYATRIAKAVYYAVENGAHVINLSVAAASLSASERRAIAYAHAKGVVVVAAAGNDGKDAAAYGPAAFEHVITVAASDPDDRRAGFSNWGAPVDIAAPGVDILSLRARRTDFALVGGLQGYRASDFFVGPEARYYRASGTSFAAPFVAGVASLLLERDPRLAPADVRRVLLQSARDIGAPGIDQETGYGLLDARAALAADPEFFIEAAFTGLEVVQKGGATFVRVSGIADADRPGAYWLELGQGEAPTRWQRVSDETRRAVKGEALADIPAQRFGGSAVWTLRLVVRHAGGRTREVQHVLRLG